MRNQICDFSSFHESLYESLVRLGEGDSLFRADCIAAASAFQQPDDDMNNVLAVTLKAQRLLRIFAAGLENNLEFRESVDQAQLQGWEGVEGVDVPAVMHQSLADKLYNITGADDIAIFEIGNKSREISALLIKRAAQEKIKFSINITDADFSNMVFNHATEDGIRALANAVVERDIKATKRIVASTLMPESKGIETTEDGKKNEKIYKSIISAIRDKSSSGEMLTTLTFLPTRAEAEIDRIPYGQYTKLFFEMCDQPWPQISNAHKVLIEQFNKASHVRFVNDWGTDIEMALVDDDGRNFTFCNSLIAKNVPGSEIFSAPRRDSVNGKIVSMGRFNADHSSDIIENLRLHFVDGCLRGWQADKGVEYFTKFIEQDEGNRYVGELGIGTNPHLKRHVVNGLLVEKIGGSFHLALGDAYKMTDYMGEPVYVDNGSRSKDHWDITTMLYGAGGQIYLDGHMIMDNGFFIDDRLDVLNRGWQAIPEKQRPAYWQNAVTPFQFDK